MKRTVGATAIMLLLFVFAGAANARPSGSETITTVLVFPYDQLPSNSGPAGTFSGTFSASGTVSDSGTVTAHTVLGGVLSPVAATQQTVRTYSGGNGTLTLRCNERFSPPGQDITKPVSLAGSCVVLDATGAYAGLRGSGSLTGTPPGGGAEFGDTAITVQDTLVL